MGPGRPARYITPETLLGLRFADRERPRWDVAVLCFRGVAGSAPLIEKLAGQPVGVKTLYGLEEAPDRPYVWEARLAATRTVIVTQCLWGGPQTAILVEELASLGVRVVIGYGVAGSLVPELRKGTQIVASAGLVTDGTSRAYTHATEGGADGAEVAVTQRLSAALSGVAARLGIELVPVKVATVDALYQETDDDVRRWRAVGAEAINMETTPLYAVGAVCGLETVWLGHVSDSLAHQHWEPWGRSAAMSDVTVALTVALLETLAAPGVSRPGH